MFADATVAAAACGAAGVGGGARCVPTVCKIICFCSCNLVFTTQIGFVIKHTILPASAALAKCVNGPSRVWPVSSLYRCFAALYAKKYTPQATPDPRRAGVRPVMGSKLTKLRFMI